MTCNNKKSIKRKIILFSSIALGIIAAIYFTFTTTNNLKMSLALPAFLSLVICPAMCVGMGGIMWLINRVYKKSNIVEIKVIDKIKKHEENDESNRKNIITFLLWQ